MLACLKASQLEPQHGAAALLRRCCEGWRRRWYHTSQLEPQHGAAAGWLGGEDGLRQLLLPQPPRLYQRPQVLLSQRLDIPIHLQESRVRAWVGGWVGGGWGIGG
jgi:hypothetical protein